MAPSVKDSNIQAFLSPSFSPTNYLNATLPSQASVASASAKTLSPSISTLVSQTQSQISSLSAQSNLLSASLTALTDDILRISPRLTYEIELLRGEALSLYDNLSQAGNLHSAISQFVTHGPEQSATELPKSQIRTQSDREDVKSSDHADESFPVPHITQPSDGLELPIEKLRTLLRVRALLTEVTQAFSLALSWPMPPSLLSASSGLVSVSAPADPAVEEEGQAACSKLRQEIISLLDEGMEIVDRKAGLERAAERVRELRECLGLWKGTGEEKARTSFVDGLDRMVEERTRRQVGAGEGNGVGGQGADENRTEGKATTSRVGPGLLRNLQRLREEIYME